MPYEQSWCVDYPGCAIFLLDRSKSMDDPFVGESLARGQQLKNAVATILNKTIKRIADACRRGTEIRRRVDIAVIGYGAGGVRSALPPNFGNQDLVSIADLMDHPLKVDTRQKEIYHPETGEVEMRDEKFPVWVVAEADNGTPMCAALQKAVAIAESWISTHQKSFPPMVINITDGEANDADPRPPAEEFRRLCTDDGNALLFNCHISTKATSEVIYPASEGELPTEDPLAGVLFEMSSELPEKMRQMALVKVKPDLKEHCRGFVFNADVSDIIAMIDITTQQR